MKSAVPPLRIADAAKAVRHVFIRNLEVLAHIGIHGHERGKPQPVRINVDLAVKDAAVLEDRLDTVVDYEAITAKIRALIGAGHINLAHIYHTFNTHQCTNRSSGYAMLSGTCFGYDAFFAQSFG